MVELGLVARVVLRLQVASQQRQFQVLACVNFQSQFAAVGSLCIAIVVLVVGRIDSGAEALAGLTRDAKAVVPGLVRAADVRIAFAGLVGACAKADAGLQACFAFAGKDLDHASNRI